MFTRREIVSGLAASASGLSIAAYSTPGLADSCPAMKPGPVSRPVRHRVSLSLRKMQAGLLNKKIDAQNEIPMSRVLGATLKSDGDILIWGLDEEVKYPRIFCDDIILAMKGMTRGGFPPGVTIDPIINAGNMADRQNVRYFGNVDGTRVGKTFFECDYWMKEIAAGARTAPIARFCSFADRLRDGSVTHGGATRFWFYPNSYDDRRSPERNTFELVGGGVKLLTEAAFLSHGNQSSPQRMSNPAVEERAQAFAEDMTTRYSELETVFPELARLRLFTELWDVFFLLNEMKLNAQSWRFILQSYSPSQAATPSSAKTVTGPQHRLGNMVFYLKGGVSIEPVPPTKTTVEPTGRLVRERNAMLEAENRGDSYYWFY
jgi:hypothetical protein